MYRARLKNIIKGDNESLSELAQSIKKLIRRAYPSANHDLLNVIALDHVIDALPDPDMRLRLRKSKVMDIGEAEIMAIRLETYKVANAQRQNHVNAIATDIHKNENQEIISLLQNIQGMLVKNNQNPPETKRYPGGDKHFNYKPKQRDNYKNYTNQHNERNSSFRDRPNQGKSHWSHHGRNDSRFHNPNQLNDQVSDLRGGSRRPEGTSPRNNGH